MPVDRNPMTHYQGDATMNEFTAERIVKSYTMRLCAQPADVFPLLCPALCANTSGSSPGPVIWFFPILGGLE
jgi:hypothetical protein